MPRCQGGTLNVDNSVIELGTDGDIGLRAGVPASTVPVVLDAEQLTVVGGDAGVSRRLGVGRGRRHQHRHPRQLHRARPHDTLSRPPDPAPGRSTCTTRTTRPWRHRSPVSGTNLNVDPGFLNPAARNYSLRATSAVLDKGDSGVVTPDDRTGGKRAVDGDGNGSPVPDMGAYELRDVTPPRTTFTTGPQGPTNNRQPVFTFRSGDAVSFECSLDGGGFQKCTSPSTTPPLADGAHSFAVRATDEVFNLENPPATKSFTVDTAVPNATITKKPAKRFFKKRIKFKFATNEPGATFQCMLDNRAWQSCNKTFRFNVKVGKHRLLVRAVDAAGNVDATPARYKYKRLPRRR